jgi:hypothetical protein
VSGNLVRSDRFVELEQKLYLMASQVSDLEKAVRLSGGGGGGNGVNRVELERDILGKVEQRMRYGDQQVFECVWEETFFSRQALWCQHWRIRSTRWSRSRSRWSG